MQKSVIQTKDDAVPRIARQIPTSSPTLKKENATAQGLGYL